MTPAEINHLADALAERLRVPSVMNTDEAAEYLKVSTQFLEIARHRGGGPRYVKLARMVRYRRVDLDAWLAEHLREHTAS